MSVNPILTQGPALAPYYTAQEIVFLHDNTATIAAPSVTYVEIPLPTQLVSGNLAILSPVGTGATSITWQANVGGLYTFQMITEWSALTQTTGYNGNVALYMAYDPLSDFDYQVDFLTPYASTSPFQSANFMHHLNVGDQFYFAFENHTSAYGALQIKELKGYLISAL